MDMITLVFTLRRKIQRGMFRRLVQMLGLVPHVNREPRRNNEFEDPSISLGMSIQSKNIAVRVVHAGGREELYKTPIPVSHLMKKYPGMCIARPEVFKNPDESILSADDKLLPGEKYYIVPCTTVKKLKRKYSGKRISEEQDQGKEVRLALTVVPDARGDMTDEYVCPAKDFYVSKETWSRCLIKKSKRGSRHFILPIQKRKMRRGLDWEPSLTSVQEISP